MNMLYKFWTIFINFVHLIVRKLYLSTGAGRRFCMHLVLHDYLLTCYLI